jgi:hypothetical protein
MNKLAIAGQQLMKGNIGNAITALTTKSAYSGLIQPSRYRNGNFFFGVNGADKAFIWGGYNSSLKAYQECSVVSSIINKKAQALVNGKRYVMDGKGKESTSLQAKQIVQLMGRPNPVQNGLQFRAQGSVYKQIYGYCPILVIKPVGFEKDYSKWRLWNLPPWMLQVTDNTQLFYISDAKPFTRIVLNYMGYTVELKIDDVFFLKENQISTGLFQMNSMAENVSMFLPDSKLFGLQTPIDNFISSVSSRGVLTRQRGPMWIMTNDSSDSGDAGMFPIDPLAKSELQNEFRQYGIMAEQRRAIITDAKLKLQTVGFDVGQLKLLEGELQDAKLISDGLNYPPYLLGLVDAKFDNQDVAERSLYTNSIIPDAQSEDEQWTSLLKMEDLGLKIETTFTHLPALQENIEQQGRGRAYMNQALLIEWLNNGITWNRWRELLGEDTVDGKDLYYSDMIKRGDVFGVVPNQAINALNPAETTDNNNGNDNSNNQN